MTDIKSWSTTASQNIDAVPNGFPEGMAPSGVNDAAREVMAAVRRQWNDAQWFDYGDGGKAGTYAFVSANQFRVISSPPADLTQEYHAGRRVKVIAPTPGTIYGTVTASSFSSPDTTVTVAFDAGNLANEALSVQLSTQRADNQGAPGAIVVDDGTAAAPSIRFRGDTDSGFFLKAAGVIGLSIGGVEQLAIADNGSLVGPRVGGWEQIGPTQDLSGAAQIDFTSGIDATFGVYEVDLELIEPGTDNVTLNALVRQQGGAFLTSSYRYAFLGRNSIGDSFSSQSQLGLSFPLAPAISNNTARPFGGWFRIYRPSDNDRTVVQWSGAYTEGANAGNPIRFISGGGAMDNGVVIDGIRIVASSGTVSGRTTLYGKRSSL